MIPGWTVARAIPHETLLGLLGGDYVLSGGVIRWAKGTANAGQIIRHLIPNGLNPLGFVPGLDLVSGFLTNAQLGEIKKIAVQNSAQLMQLSQQSGLLVRSTQQLLQIATGTAVLSGLGLAVSAISFVVIGKKLNTIDGKLKEIQKDVKDIKYFLESSERASLFSALSSLLKISAKTLPEHRHTILHNVRDKLSVINMRYKELLENTDKIEAAIAYEEYFSLTALALTRCTAELGMLDVALQEIEEASIIWTQSAQRILKELLIQKYPERFLATDFAEELSILELVQWLDFAYGENKGLVWIDDLRLKINQKWYWTPLSTNWFKDLGSGLNQNIGVGLKKEKELVIPLIRKLVARNSVFEGFRAQYSFFEENEIKPSHFEASLKQLPQSQSVDGYWILEPTF